MKEHILSAALTFSLLAGGTAAIGHEMFARAAAPATQTVVMLPAVNIVGHRQPATAVVMLPAVHVTGHRAVPESVTVAARASDSRRIE